MSSFSEDFAISKHIIRNRVRFWRNSFFLKVTYPLTRFLRPDPNKLKSSGHLRALLRKDQESLPGLLAIDLLTLAHAVATRKLWQELMQASFDNSDLVDHARYLMLRALEAGPKAKLHDLSVASQSSHLTSERNLKTLDFVLSIPFLVHHQEPEVRRRYDVFEIWEL